MTLYRVLNSLKIKSGIIQRGNLVSGDFFEPQTLDRLIKFDVLSAISAPPLSELPGFKPKALEKLSLINIYSADQLLECDMDMTAEQTGLSLNELRTMQDLAKRWLTVEKQPHG